MEILEALIFSLVLGGANVILSGLLRMIMHVFATVIIIKEDSQISLMDRYLADNGWCSSRTVTPGKLPSDGAHMAMRDGIMIAIRSSITKERNTKEKYTVFTFSHRSAKKVYERLMGNTNDVICRYIYSPSPWRTSCTAIRCVPPSTAYSWQQNAVMQFVGTYTVNGCASGIVSGSSGIGKSTLGELVALEIKKRKNTVPEVIKGFNLMAKGLLLNDAVDTPTYDRPVILMLDEFDEAVAHAEASQESDKSECSSLADNPTSLLSLLDHMNIIQHMIVIATTNKPFTDIPERYIRKGRLDLRIMANSL
jgi:hypothetical protein